MVYLLFFPWKHFLLHCIFRQPRFPFSTYLYLFSFVATCIQHSGLVQAYQGGHVLLNEVHRGRALQHGGYRENWYFMGIWLWAVMLVGLSSSLGPIWAHELVNWFDVPSP